MLNCTMNILPRKEYIKALYRLMLARSELNKYYIVQRLLYYVGRMVQNSKYFFLSAIAISTLPLH